MIDSPNPHNSDKQPDDQSDASHANAQESHVEQQSPQTRKTLRQIGRARTRLLVCLLTLPVYVAAVWFLLQNQRGTDTFMFFYMAMWAGFGFDMARRRCPECDQQFYVKTVFLNLITKRCVHCGLTAQRVTPAAQQNNSRQF